MSELKRSVQGQTVSLREVRSLNASGDEMLLETSLQVEHGYQGNTHPLEKQPGCNVGKDVRR